MDTARKRVLRRGRPGEEMGFAEGDEQNDIELVVNFFFFIRKTLPFSFIHFRSKPIAEVASYARGVCGLGKTGDPDSQN